MGAINLRSGWLVWGLLAGFGAGPAWAATNIYRSVGPANTSALVSGSNFCTLTLASGTATFSAPLSLNIGVGDVLLYDSDGNATLDSSAFIHGRSSSAVFILRDGGGGIPADAPSGTMTWSIYRAYTSLAEAECGRENGGIPSALRDFESWSDGRDLVTNDEIWNLACYGEAAADTVYANFSDWDTQATNFIRVFTPTLASEVGVSQRHNGTWSNSAYRMEVTTDNPLDIRQRCLRLEGLQFRFSDVTHDEWPMVWISGNGNPLEIKISHCIFRGMAAGTLVDNKALEISDYDGGSGDVKVWNNVFYDFDWDSTTGGVYLGNANINCYFYNNTLVGCRSYGFMNVSGTAIAMNNLSQDSSDGYAGVFDAASDYNLSDLAADAPGTHAKNSTTVSFVNAAAGDYHLQPGDTGARDAGTSLAGDAHQPFSDDIDGQTRPALPAIWDIGADEVVEIETYTPTPTPTATLTSTVSPVYSPTFTPTRTPTATRTATATRTSTITFTSTPTLTPTRTVTPTRTHSATATETRTASPTFTATSTFTISPTPTISPTRTQSPTITITFTPSPTRTITSTRTPVAFTAREAVAYPQPTTGDSLYFYYPLDEPGEVEIEIFNVLGEPILTLRDAKAGLGYERTRWDIRNAAPGVYFYRLRTKTSARETTTPIKKIIITKIKK